MSQIIPKLSKMLSRVINLETILFPLFKEDLRLEELSKKESKLIKILDFAEIEKNITVVTITNTPKDREEMARAFVAKSVYNIQTTRDLIDRLHSDRVLRVLCGWRYSREVLSESKFSRVFKEFSDLELAQKTQEKFVQKYLSDTIFLYNATDATKIPLRQKPIKVKKKVKTKYKRGRPKKDEIREPMESSILTKQKDMQTPKAMLELVSTMCGVGIKKNSKGNREKWIGGKLHISVVDGDIPITAFYSGANVQVMHYAEPML